MPDFYAQVPKDLAGNLEYRIEVRTRAAHDPAFARALWAACRHDVLYFFNAFCWLYEPRPRVVGGVNLPPVIPFITWAHQDPAILAIKENLGFRDIGAEKSRGEGASWISILMALHEWLFEPMTAIGLVSRNESAVDSPEDPDSLMWKLDWELTRLPTWMTPRCKRSIAEHTLRNVDNGSTISGYAATGDVASGGRKKWFLMDELAKFPRGPDMEAMASTQHVTNSRLVVSTPKGTDGAYYRLMHEPSSLVKVILDWRDNPTRNRGLYRFAGGKPVAVDPVNNPLPPNYDPPDEHVVAMFSRLRSKGFKLEDCLRSPWYDNECDRAGATPQNIAQELDRDYGGSMYRVFGIDFLDKAASTVCEPLLRGVLDYDRETLEPDFQATPDGPLLLWTHLGAKGNPPAHYYVVGADVAAGTGGSYSSNSTMEVIDVVTMEQVLEWATNTVEPGDWAEYCISVAKWFNDAYLVWESNGPTGSAFTKRILQKGYGNIYYRTAQTKRGKQKTKSAGWYTTDGNDGTKGIMFSALRRAVVSGGLLIRSRATVRECGEYVWQNGKIVNIHTATNEDESAAGAAHGDRVIALCVANQGVDDRPVPNRDLVQHEVSPYCMAGRMLEYEKSLRRQADDWDDRENGDLMHPHRSVLCA